MIKLKELVTEATKKEKPTDDVIRTNIRKYTGGRDWIDAEKNDPYDVAEEIGKQYGWNEQEIEKAEKIILKKYIK